MMGRVAVGDLIQVEDIAYCGSEQRPSIAWWSVIGTAASPHFPILARRVDGGVIGQFGWREVLDRVPAKEVHNVPATT